MEKKPLKVKPKDVEPVHLTTKQKLLNLLDAGYKINQAAGALGLKRSEAQRIVDYD